MIHIKRVYEQASKNDGMRILVDHLWPRGLSKEKANIDLWLKEISPSTALRRWFNHDPHKWNEFKKKYFEELKDKKELVDQLKAAADKTVTLVYAARDEQYNNAQALKKYLERH